MLDDLEEFSTSPVISFAASKNSPPMKTLSAILPSLLVVVWKDWPGASEKQFKLRQSFQSARPIRGRPCGPSLSSVYWIERCKCSLSGSSVPGWLS